MSKSKRLKKKIKSNTELAKSIRKMWTMNPVTRIKVDEQLDSTKRRQSEKKIVKECD